MTSIQSYLRRINFIINHNHNDDDDNDDGDGTTPNTAKTTAMIVLFTCSFTLGCLPIKLTKWLIKNNNNNNYNDNQVVLESNRYVQMLLGFGGGVLLCTTFLHLLPEVSETFDDLNLTPNIEIHYAELLMCCGFFLMYLVEECVHLYLHKREKEPSLSPLVRSLSIRRGDTPRQSLDNVQYQEKPPTVQSQSQPPLAALATSHNHHHSHVIIEPIDSTVKAIRGLLVVLALTVHELFEGLAVGLESSAGNVWYMFGAVAAHKLVIAFCIGVELLTTGIKISLIILYVFSFAIVSPLGIGIGMTISNIKHSNTIDIVSVFLQGIATGTLLYVVFFEILQNDRKVGLRQYLSIFIGFVFMFGLTMIE